MWPVASFPQSFPKTFFGKPQSSLLTGSRSCQVSNGIKGSNATDYAGLRLDCTGGPAILFPFFAQSAEEPHHAIIFSVLSGNRFYPETVLTENVFLYGCTICPEAADNPWVLCLLSSLPHNKDNRSVPFAFFCMPDNAMFLFADIFYPLLTIVAMKTDKNQHDRLHKQDMPYRCFSYC